MHQSIDIFPAKHTVTSEGRLEQVLPQIRSDLEERLRYFKEDLGDMLKYERLKAKVEYDIEMMQEVGYVNGIENYSRYLDGRNPGEAPATLIDYFGKDFLTFIDESHMTIPQVGAMYG
jgi:excinuclease ABC subunit B